MFWFFGSPFFELGSIGIIIFLLMVIAYYITEIKSKKINIKNIGKK